MIRTIRRRRGPAVLLVALLLPGCLPVAVGGAAGMLGGGRAPAAGDSAGMPSGSGVQHARAADRSIGDALAASEGEVGDACRSQLPDRRDEAPPAGPHAMCGFRLVCLPRALAPARLYVCERAGDRSAAAGAASR